MSLVGMFIIGFPRSRRAAVAVAGLSLLAGCGGTDTTGSSSGVASIQQPSAAPAQAAAATERPVIRLDSSASDKARMQDVYIDCLLSHGFPAQAVVKGQCARSAAGKDAGSLSSTEPR